LVFCAAFFLAPLIRLITWQFTFEPHLSIDENIVRHIYFPFHTHIDGLLMGLMLSNLEVRGIFKEKKSFIKGLMIVLIGFVLFLLFRKFSKTFFAYTSLSFLFGSTITFILITKKNIFGKLLSNKFFYVISKLSFGMYLTHQFAMHEIANQVNSHFTFGSDLVKFLLFLTLSTFTSMIISFFGFSLIEQPFLKLRSKLGLEH